MTQNIKPFRKVFVVIDPTRMIQPALIKGEWIAANDDAELVLYCCIYDEQYADNEPEQQTELELTRDWLTRLAAPLREKGTPVEIRAEWNADWRSSLLTATQAEDNSLVIKLASHHSAMGRRLKTTSDLLLVQECVCPVLLVAGNRLWDNGRLLAAVKLKPEDETHKRLNDRLLELSHSFATRAELNLYAVTAYKGDDFNFDRQQFADSCRLPRDQVFSAEGAPERVIAKIAEEIKANVIVIGNPGDGERNTAVLLIDLVQTDILFLPEFQ
jgi:universal stress protein E